jgi:anti-sigma B factor antagonist
MTAVSVTQLPECIEHGKRFLAQMEDSINVDHPRIVLDCSQVARMGRQTVQVLLCCLEEAMKRNGDVRLAAVCPDARVVLQQTGADRLFEIFDTTEEAVEGFYHRCANPEFLNDARGVSPLRSETAA